MGLSLVGYIIGILIGFFIGGAIGGILLSSIYRDRKGTIVLSSAIGFGIGGFLGIVVASAFFCRRRGFHNRWSDIRCVWGYITWSWHVLRRKINYQPTRRGEQITCSIL